MMTTTDKEQLSPKDDERMLLELAAKAADYGFSFNRKISDDAYEWKSVDGMLWQWNPLIDDGQALRLAVKLNIQSCWFDRLGYAVAVSVPDFLPVISVREDGKDPYAATRRAIVRAAASIGEKL